MKFLKESNSIYLVFFIFTLLVFNGCVKDKRKTTFTANVPIYLTIEELNSTLIRSDVPQEIVNPGKIYFKDNYIFINEIKKGVHVFDISNPASPQNIAFINIPENMDIAIKGNILYADNYTDLLAIDITNISSTKLVKRIGNAIQYNYPETGNEYPCQEVKKEKGIVVGWKLERITTTEEINTSYGYYNYNNIFLYCDMATFQTNSANYYAAPTNQNPNSSGKGGSLARFTIVGNNLFTIDYSSMSTYEISNNASPEFVSKNFVGFDIETIFPYQDNLFLGSQTGMSIYSISNPSKPTFVSNFSHARRCDPVVVSGNKAYVTLRAGNVCGGNLSELDVINISNIAAPYLEKSYPMTEPYGLGIDKNILFVCDGKDGLKIYDASNASNIDKNMLSNFTNTNPVDVIPYNNLLMTIGKNDFLIYDYSNPKEIKLLSRIPVTKN